MCRKIQLLVLLAAQGVLAGMVGLAQTAPGSIPGFFFSEWTVTSNCTEAHAGLAARVATGLKFKISPDSLTADGSYLFQAEDVAPSSWAAGWNGLKLQYRPGPAMSSVPADFVCVPGQESSSPFLAMSGFASSAEPYYQQAHWYGLATIYGQQEHILIFPRPEHGPNSAIIVLVSVNAPGSVQLDDDGAVNSED
jgi:hypothetical protein